MRRRSPVTRSLLDMRNGESPGVYDNFCIWRSFALLHSTMIYATFNWDLCSCLQTYRARLN